MAPERHECVHCRDVAAEPRIEWNPVDRRWQCRNAVACAKRHAERKLAANLYREMRGN